MVIVVVLHMLRVIFTGAYKLPRQTNYVIGIALLVGTLLLNFTGYVLRWDEGTHWALVVGTNLIKDIPLIGNTLYQISVGGSQIDTATTVRFYGWHLFGLTIPALILIVWHSFKVRRDGGISRQQRVGDHALQSRPADRYPRYLFALSRTRRRAHTGAQILQRISA